MKKKVIQFNKALYVLEPQLKIITNDKYYDIKKDLEYAASFDEYCTNCACYNLLTDLEEKYPEDIEFFWSEEGDTFGFIFRGDSKIAKRLQFLGIISEPKEKFCEILF